MNNSDSKSQILFLININDWFKIDTDIFQTEQFTLNQLIILDFEKIDSLDPKGVMMLIIISQSIYKKTKKKLEIRNINSDLLSYLEKIKLFKLNLYKVDLKTLIWNEYSKEVFYESIIEITKVKSLNEKHKLILDVSDVLSVWFPEEQYKQLRYNTLITLLELCGNSLEHSTIDDKYGEFFFVLQKYSRRDHVEICIVIGDLGIGIRKHLTNKYGDIYEQDYQYIVEALKGKSGRLDGSGGMGFKAIQQTTKNNNGILTVKSNKGTVSIDNELNFFESKYGIVGTQCSITLKNYETMN